MYRENLTVGPYYDFLQSVSHSSNEISLNLFRVKNEIFRSGKWALFVRNVFNVL